MRKSFLFCIVMAIVFSCVLASGVSAEETGSGDAEVSILASGSCGADGDNLTWVLDDEGTLTISGEGRWRTSQMKCLNGIPTEPK